MCQLDGSADERAADSRSGEPPRTQQQRDVELWRLRRAGVARSLADDKSSHRLSIAFSDVESTAQGEPVYALAGIRPLGERDGSPLPDLAALDEPGNRLVEQGQDGRLVTLVSGPDRQAAHR
jgi:hypothetical protein